MDQCNKRVIVIDSLPRAVGESIAAAVAEKLQLPFYGAAEQLAEAARLSSISQRILEKYAERRLLAAYDISAQDYDKINLPPARDLLTAKNVAAIRLSDAGACILAGLHASMALSEKPDVIRVFVFTREGGVLHSREEKRRRAYYRAINNAWGTLEFYQFTLDVTELRTEGAAEWVARFYSES